MTVLEAIQKSADFLERKSIDSPRLQAELLLAMVLALPRLRLYLEFERPLKDHESAALRELVLRRAERIPLQHLTRSTSFCGHEIIVTPATLIPRPETETLAEKAWEFLHNLKRDSIFLDVGTGSGCLPVAIASHAKEARGLAVDLSKEALAIATANVQANHLADRVQLKQSDLFENVTGLFDLIVSNPPYIPTAEIAALEPEVRDHDPRLALDGGSDGLDFYRAIAQQAANFLKPNGRLMLEFGDGQAPALLELFTTHGWIVQAVHRDLSKRERVLIASR